jgi:hypothetical protein
MNKKISITVVLTIAAVLTAYISTLTLSNQAFAQGESRDEVIWAKTFGSEEAQAGKILAGEEAQTGKILAGHLDERPHCQESEGIPCQEPIPTTFR